MYDLTIVPGDALGFWIKSAVISIIGLLIWVSIRNRLTAAIRCGLLLAFTCSIGLLFCIDFLHIVERIGMEKHRLPVVADDFSASHWFTWGWGVVAAALLFFFLLRILVGEWRCYRARIVASKTASGHFRVATSDCESPYTQGILLPTIFVPIGFERWPNDVRTHVEMHEAAHIDRCDMLWTYVTLCVSALVWFIPSTWLYFWVTRFEQEQCCDNTVLRNGEKAGSYCETLLTMTDEPPVTSSRLASAISMAGREPAMNVTHGGQLFFARLRLFLLNKRVMSIINRKTPRSPLTTPQMVIVFLVAILTSSTMAMVDVSADQSFPHGVQHVVSFVQSSTNDAEENVNSGYIDLDSRDLEFIFDAPRKRKQIIGIRFDKLPLPPRAEILSARLEFSLLKPSTEMVQLQIDAQSTCVTTPFTRTRYDISSRLNPQRESIDWIIPGPLTIPGTITSPELRQLLQPLTHQSAWSTSPSVVFVLSSFDQSASINFCVAAAFDNTERLSPPRLIVRYQYPE